MMVEFVQNGLSSAIFPKVYSIWNSSNDERKSTQEVNKYFNGLALVSVMVLPAFLILIPYVIILFINNTGMYETFYIFPILTIGFVTRSLQAMFQLPLYYYERTKSLPRVYFVSAIFQVILNIILIKYYGILGAAITIVIVKIIQTVLLYFESKRIFTFRFNVVKQILLPLIYLILIVAMFPFTFEKWEIFSDIGWNRLFINSVQFVLITAVSYGIFKKDIDEGVHKYRGQLSKFKLKTIFKSAG
jgi:O-antigen/teichoic acid export membrane protein